jgi:predicted nucleic acid-binding protein
VKILADTSVWSLALRRRKTSKLSREEQQLTRLLAQAIGDGRVVMIGPIRQELLSGIKELGQFETLRTNLQPFLDERLDTPDCEEAARMYNVCRAQGVECGPVGMLICAVALRRKWHVLANDASLNRCMEILQTWMEAQGKIRK